MDFNFDDRIQKLTERHEALAQSVELNTLQINALTGKLDALTGKVDTLIPLVGQIAEGTVKLLRISELHEHRLDNHQRRLEGLEG